MIFQIYAYLTWCSWSPPPKFYGYISSHYTCVKWYFRSMQIWLDVVDPLPKFYGCILSCYTSVKWHFRSMQIWLDVADPPQTKILQMHFIMLHLCQTIFYIMQIWLDVADPPLPKFYGCILSCYTTAVQPISIQPLQTQQKPRCTEAQHNAEKHYLLIIHSPSVFFCCRGYRFWCWWLVRVTLVVAFGFLPQNFGRWQGPTMVLRHSMNTGSVVGIPWGGGDTRTLPHAK